MEKIGYNSIFPVSNVRKITIINPEVLLAKRLPGIFIAIFCLFSQAFFTFSDLCYVFSSHSREQVASHEGDGRCQQDLPQQVHVFFLLDGEDEGDDDQGEDGQDRHGQSAAGHFEDAGQVERQRHVEQEARDDGPDKVFDHREDAEVLVFVVDDADYDNDGAGGCHAAGESADGHEEALHDGTALLVAHHVPTAGQNLTEDGARQGVGDGDDILVEVVVADHAAVHEHALRHGQVGVAAAEGQDR